MKVWVITSIGCIECGAENVDPVISVCTSEAMRDAVLAKMRSELNEFEVTYREEHGGFTTSDSQIRCQQIEVSP